MSDEQQRSGTARKVAKGTKTVVLAPFRAVAQSGKLTWDQYRKTYQYGKGTFDQASETIRENWQRAHKKGRNDQFFEIFGGPDGPELLQRNLRRFLLKKRAALACMAAFFIYGLVCAIVFKAYSGLLGMIGALILGTAMATDAQFRLWQLRTHRLSVEERGSGQNFFREEPIRKIFDPEILGGRRHGN
jgi:hypothetical protein